MARGSTRLVVDDAGQRLAFIFGLLVVMVGHSHGFSVVGRLVASRHVRHGSSSVVSDEFNRQRQYIANSAPAPSTTHLSGAVSGGGGDDIDLFMSDLRSRVEEVAESSAKLPLVVLDAMLPRQVLNIQVSNPLFLDLIKTRIEQENPSFGMLGNAKLVSGKQVMLKYGVEVEFESPGVDEETGSIRLTLRATRRFCIADGTVENAPGGWTQARVEYLDSEKQEEEEVGSYEISGDDRLSLARAMRKARELTSPNMLMKDQACLVDRWIELARSRERQEGQIDGILNDLGPIPAPEEPSERAFWIGALINPIPAMGVAVEIRPSLLTAKTAESRVQIAFDAMFRSIKHMEGSENVVER